MKKTTLLLSAFLVSATVFGQSFTTGVMNFAANYNVQIDVNASTNIVTMTMNGPSDRYFAIGFGVTNMGTSGSDCVMYLGTAGTGLNVLSDRSFNGSNTIPSLDSGAQDWNVVSNTVMGTTRTIVATRARATAGDYAFPTTALSAVNFAWAVKGTADYVLAYHGSTRGALQANFTLGNSKFETDSFSMYPNPAKDQLSFQFPTYINKGTIKIYDALGRVVNLQEISATDMKVQLQNFATGTYLVVVRTDFGNSTQTLLVQ